MESIDIGIPRGVAYGRAVEKTPYKIRQAGALWWGTVIALASIVAFGIYGFVVQLTQGLAVTGMRDIGTGGGAAWSVYIGFDVYFVGVSFAGVSTAALVRLFNLTKLRPLSRMAEALTVIALPLAAMVTISDLGQPLRGLLNLLRYARPMSPFFGTFTLVIAGYLFSSVVFLFLSGRRDAAICARQPSKLQWFYKMWATGYTDTPEERKRHEKISFWLSLTILPLLIVAHSTLGLIFGLQGGRPGWFSAISAPSFVIMAGVSGIGFLVIIAAIVRRTLGLKEQLNLDVFRWLGNMLWVLIAAYLYFTVVEMLTAIYAAPAGDTSVWKELLSGQYAVIFWTSIGLLIVSFLNQIIQFLTKHHSIAFTVLTGVMVNIAAIGKRFLIVVPSQTVGTVLPYPHGTYAPTWVEYSIITALFALGTLVYIVFVKVFPIVEIPEND